MVDKLLFLYGVVLVAIGLSTLGMGGPSTLPATIVGLAVGSLLIAVSISDKIAVLYFRKSKKREIANKLRR